MIGWPQSALRRARLMVDALRLSTRNFSPFCADDLRAREDDINSAII